MWPDFLNNFELADEDLMNYNDWAYTYCDRVVVINEERVKNAILLRKSK